MSPLRLNPPGTCPRGTRWTLDPIQVSGPYSPCGGTTPYTYPQTFLGIRTPAPVEGLGAVGRQFQQSAGTAIRPTERPTREELRRIVREVMER